MQGGQDLFLGINEDNLGELAIDLVNKLDELSELFSKIDNKMVSLKSCYNCDSYESLINSYNEFRKNYVVVKNTVLSYSDDLIAVINKIRSGDRNIALLVDELGRLPLDKAKEIEQIGGV